MMLFSITFVVVDGCDVPTQVLNGKIETETEAGYNVVKVFCDAGYKLVGAGFVYCLNDSKWDAPIGICKPAQPGKRLPSNVTVKLSVSF